MAKLVGWVMQVTRAADYAMRAMIYLARQEVGKLSNIKDIAEHEKVPEKFMRKLVHILHKSGYIESERGKYGGVRLRKAPEFVTILDIYVAIEGPIAINICLKGPDLCDFQDTCSVCDVWKQAQDTFIKVLKQHTLKEMADNFVLAEAI